MMVDTRLGFVSTRSLVDRERTRARTPNEAQPRRKMPGWLTACVIVVGVVTLVAMALAPFSPWIDGGSSKGPIGVIVTGGIVAFSILLGTGAAMNRKHGNQ